MVVAGRWRGGHGNRKEREQKETTVQSGEYDGCEGQITNHMVINSMVLTKIHLKLSPKNQERGRIVLVTKCPV